MHSNYVLLTGVFLSLLLQQGPCQCQQNRKSMYCVVLAADFNVMGNTEEVYFFKEIFSKFSK